MRVARGDFDSLFIHALVEQGRLITFNFDVACEVLGLLGDVAHNLDDVDNIGTACCSHHDDGCHNDLEHCAHGDPQRKFCVSLCTANVYEGFNQS